MRRSRRVPPGGESRPAADHDSRRDPPRGRSRPVTGRARPQHRARRGPGNGGHAALGTPWRDAIAAGPAFCAARLANGPPGAGRAPAPHRARRVPPGTVDTPRDAPRGGRAPWRGARPRRIRHAESPRERWTRRVTRPGGGVAPRGGAHARAASGTPSPPWAEHTQRSPRPTKGPPCGVSRAGRGWDAAWGLTAGRAGPARRAGGMPSLPRPPGRPAVRQGAGAPGPWARRCCPAGAPTGRCGRFSRPAPGGAPTGGSCPPR
ncbi:hypothetical protein SUDANB108_05768 [Streptomyces sp. enrichment culture]